MSEYFDVFHRTWWKENPGWPNGLEPQAGEKHYLRGGRGLTREDAIEMCEDWNSQHEAGRLSDKAEFEEA